MHEVDTALTHTTETLDLVSFLKREKYPPGRHIGGFIFMGQNLEIWGENTVRFWLLGTLNTERILEFLVLLTHNTLARNAFPQEITIHTDSDDPNRKQTNFIIAQRLLCIVSQLATESIP